MAGLSYKKDLEHQLRDAYGKVVYTYTCFLKQMCRLKKRECHIKMVQIVISAFSTVGVFSVIFVDAFWLKGLSAIFSVVLLCITLYFKDFHLSEDIRQFIMGADELWSVREDYISLLTDINQMSDEEVARLRNSLKERTLEIYKKYPKTDGKSYAEAQKALKEKEEQFFSDEEIDMMLPKHLRWTL